MAGWLGYASPACVENDIEHDGQVHNEIRKELGLGVRRTKLERNSPLRDARVRQLCTRAGSALGSPARGSRCTRARSSAQSRMQPKPKCADAAAQDLRLTSNGVGARACPGNTWGVASHIWFCGAPGSDHRPDRPALPRRTLQPACAVSSRCRGGRRCAAFWRLRLSPTNFCT